MDILALLLLDGLKNGPLDKNLRYIVVFGCLLHRWIQYDFGIRYVFIDWILYKEHAVQK
jgi:hypothetical protein